MHPEAAKQLTKKNQQKKTTAVCGEFEILSLSLVSPGFRTSDFEFTKGTVE
jgi:hypothetical protein